jgi:serine/threonine protein kinase
MSHTVHVRRVRSCAAVTNGSCKHQESGLPLAAGTTFGPYQIIDQLGAGGMGVVYRAHDSRLQRDVAIKVLPAHTLGDENARARFRREALALAKLSHPNIATLFDLGEQDDSSYLVMECVAGDTLASMLERGPLPIPDVLALGIEIAGALDEAHGQGIVHRDLKPANVIVTPKGHAKVLDFGLAHRSIGRRWRAFPLGYHRHCRDAFLHVARTGEQRAYRRADRRLESRRPAVRGTDGITSIPGALDARHTACDLRKDASANRVPASRGAARA